MDAIPPLIEPPVNRRRWWIHLILLGAYVLVAGVVGLTRVKSQTPALTHTVGGLLFVCAMELLVFGCVFGLACYASRATRDDLRLRWRGKFKPVLLGAGYSLAFRLVIAIIFIMATTALMLTHLVTPDSLQAYVKTNRPDVETLVDVTAMGHNPAYYWLTLTLVSFLVAGLREELWRSAFLAGLKALWPQYFGSRLGQVGAVVVVAIFFAFAHLPLGLIGVVNAGFLGVGLGLIMVFHRSIWPAVIAHGFFDMASMAMIPWAMQHYQ